MSYHQPAELLSTTTYTHTGFCIIEQHEQTRAVITIFPINQMLATRSGTRYTVSPEYHGRYARQEAVFSNREKREAFGQQRATRFQTGQRKEKRIKLGNPAPPTPRRDELITLERATRSTNPTCLHFGLKLEVRQFLHPIFFLCSLRRLHWVHHTCLERESS